MSSNSHESPWRECYSAKQKAKYWFNSVTGESRWTSTDSNHVPSREVQERKTPNDDKSEWTEGFSQTHKRKFWYNHQNEEYKWDTEINFDHNSDAGPESKKRQTEEPNSTLAKSNPAETVPPIEACPEALLWKRQYLFRSLSADQISNLRMDDVAAYSVTEVQSAETITRLLRGALPIDRSVAILDGMACVGGNTISFASAFDRVLSNEMNPRRYEMLEHNVRNVLKLENVTFFNQSILDLAFSRSDYQILFLDPEWGGPDYKDKVNLRLVISDEPLEDFCLRVFQRCPHVSVVGLKLPVNYDNGFIREFARKHGLKYTFYSEHLKRMTLTVLTRH
jgi:hypothetical protein